MKKLLLFSVIVAGISVSASAAKPPNPQEIARQVDELILESVSENELVPVGDAIYLRRVSFDIIGRPATPAEIHKFTTDESGEKRAIAVDQLLESEDYGTTWSRYWQDAMLRRATNARAGLVRASFEEWMSDSLNENRSWKDIVTDMVTATGKVQENGATALVFAHEGEPEEVSAEASRLFMGIQIQCAQCHNHPWDRWKRDEFHEFTAFFPRITVRRDPATDMRQDYIVGSRNQNNRRRQGVTDFLLTRLDRNKDQVISEAEAARSPLRRLFARERVTERVDANGDGQLSIEEIRKARPENNNRPGQGSVEHFMPDLENPESEGTRMDPVFFLNNKAIRKGQTDEQRRSAAARFITSPGNDWFARALVNRLWTELTGSGFGTPVDDIGPDREILHEDALDVLADGFVASGHDLKWLFRTITATEIYQQELNPDEDGLLRREPLRLRSDQVHNALLVALDLDSLTYRGMRRGRAQKPGDRYMRGIDPGRRLIEQTFGFDPSTPRDDVTGSIPQALFLMNSPQMEGVIRVRSPRGPLGDLLDSSETDEDVVRRMYLRVLGRDATDQEQNICVTSISQGQHLDFAYEDVFWALINSSEFLTKR